MSARRNERKEVEDHRMAFYAAILLKRHRVFIERFDRLERRGHDHYIAGNIYDKCTFFT